MHQQHSLQAPGSGHQPGNTCSWQHMQPARPPQNQPNFQLASRTVNDRKLQLLASTAHVRAMALTHCNSWAPFAGDHNLITGDALDSLACSVGDMGVSNTECSCSSSLVVQALIFAGQGLMRSSVTVTSKHKAGHAECGQERQPCVALSAMATCAKGSMQGCAILVSSRLALGCMASTVCHHQQRAAQGTGVASPIRVWLTPPL